MDADEQFKMSSLLEACEKDETTLASDETTLASDEVAARESCNSFKTTAENNDSADSSSNQSSATSLEEQQTVLLRHAFGKSKDVSEKNKTSFHEVLDTSTKPAEPKELGSEDKALTPSVGDASDDVKQSDAVELKPDEAGKETTTTTTLEEQVKDKNLENSQIVDSAASGESAVKRSQLNLPVEVGQNVDYLRRPDPPANHDKVIGDALPQAHVDGDKPDGGETPTRRTGFVVPSSPPGDGVGPDIETPISSVVTILKPKAQSVVDVEDVAAAKKTPSFFIASIVSGRLDLGDSAELIDDLIYWRSPKKTAAVFTSVLSVLLALQVYSLISVMAYVSLACLACGFFGRLYSTSHGTVNPILQFSPALSEENVRKFTDMALFHVNDIILSMRRLYMVDDLGDSVKFALVLWYLTYVGLWFNGMTIVTISFVTIFTLPNVYEHNKEAIDDKMASCWEQWLCLTDMARTVSQESLKRILSNERHEKVQ